MNPIVLLVILYVIWITFWGVYNFVLLERKISTETSPFFLTFVYFGFSLLTILVSKYLNLGQLVYYILCFLTISLIGFFIKKKTLGRLSNSLFQISWLFSVFSIVSNNLFLLVLIFPTGHIPIFLAKHLKLYSKLLIILFSVIGGLFFSLYFVALTFPLNLVVSTAAHYFFYHILRPIDQKYHLNIIN